VDPEAARRARYRYGCFEQFGEDIQTYGYAASFDLSKSCEGEVIAQLMEMIRRAADLASRDGRVDPDEFFTAEQNARVVKNAERYYRAMFAGKISSWNLRDTHMVETLEQLVDHLGPAAKIVVWAHNSHLGDARATEMGQQGELNVGQLIRQKYGTDAVLIGFTTYTGTVTAASNWDGPAEQKYVLPALSQSFEALFHATGTPSFLAIMRGNAFLTSILSQPRLDRAISVLYLPRSERVSHYFQTKLAEQFDRCCSSGPDARTSAAGDYIRVGTRERSTQNLSLGGLATANNMRRAKLMIRNGNTTIGIIARQQLAAR